MPQPKRTVADVDQTFCKLVLVGNAVELRTPDGEWLIRCEAPNPRQAMKRFGALLDAVEDGRRKTTNPDQTAGVC